MELKEVAVEVIKAAIWDREQHINILNQERNTLLKELQTRIQGQISKSEVLPVETGQTTSGNGNSDEIKPTQSDVVTPDSK